MTEALKWPRSRALADLLSVSRCLAWDSATMIIRISNWIFIKVESSLTFVFNYLLVVVKHLIPREIGFFSLNGLTLKPYENFFWEEAFD